MAAVREGSKGALAVVDVQVGVMGDAWADRVGGHIARALDRARAAAVAVLWVQHQHDELVPDTRGWQWVPEPVPAEGEPQVLKEYSSS